MPPHAYCFSCAVLFAIAIAQAAWADTIAVNTNSGGIGGPDCTLRDAMTAANTDMPTGGCPAGNGADIIELPVGATISLTDVDNDTEGPNGLPSVSSVLTINGNGATVRGAGAPTNFRIILVAESGDLILNDLTVSRGWAFYAFPDSGVPGGGIWNGGTLTLTNSTLSNNTSVMRGGGIYNVGTLTLTNSTVSGNSAWAPGLFYSVGGGIWNDGTLTLTNSTVSDNFAWSGGDGIWNSDTGTATLTHSIVADHSSDCSGNVIDDGYNIVEDGTCITAETSFSGDPMLGPLADNGGPTETHRPLPGSPAIDAIPTDDCTVDTDQRGFPRPQGDGCDIGAYEVQPAVCGDGIFQPGEEECDPPDGLTCNENCMVIITVTSDSGGTGGPDCTLRDAITAANTDTVTGGCPAGRRADIINLPVGATITLTEVDNDVTFGPNGLPSTTGVLTINGNNATIRRDSGAEFFRLIRVGGNLTLNDLTVSGGFAQAGGGIRNGGHLSLINSTVSGNVSDWRGGGIYNSGVLSLTNSTVSGNIAERLKSIGCGGGIWSNGSVTLTNSTVSGNTAGDGGGGILNSGPNSMWLTNTTVSDNMAGFGGGILNAGGNLLLTNSIVANSTSGADCENTTLPNSSCYFGIQDDGTVIDDGYNSIEDGGCISAETSSAGDPMLGPLADNGGPTETHALLDGSPAIDTIPSEDCLVDTDQRGIPRPQGDSCDIGAYEFADVVPLTILSSDPPDGSIDARQPSDMNGSDPTGWDAIDIVFNSDASFLDPDDFEVLVSRGRAPNIFEVVAEGNVVTITLDDRIPVGECTTFLHIDSGTSVSLGYVPADVNGDGTSGPIDILHLIDGLNGTLKTPLEIWQCDTNRSELCDPSDILPVIDLLNGAGDFDSWNGVLLPACP